MNKLQKLYCRTQTGAIQEWEIIVEGSTLITRYGQVGGVIQETRDTITSGKNTGKKNETSPEQQAEKEAEARWKKQLKKKYVKTIEEAEGGQVDELVEGGILPMLAPNKSYPKDNDLIKSIVFPCFFQPKLDGMRDIAITENGICTLWSRTRKLIKTVPHINKALEEAFPTGRVVLDGELYNHEFRAEFEELISLLRGDEPDKEGRYLQAEYHVYDCLEQNIDGFTNLDSSFYDRNLAVDSLFKFAKFNKDSPIQRVPTFICNNLEELLERYEVALFNEYEGGMARNVSAPYESGRRSKHLQKMKEWITEEFPIIGFEDGRGKDHGTIAKFICSTPEGKPFGARLKATYKRRTELFHDHSQWKDQILTVRYKRLTSDKIPYIPIGICIRNYE